MKSLWGFGISLQASIPGVSATEPTILHGRGRTKVWLSYLSVFSVATAAVVYPFAVNQDHPFFDASAGGAIAIGAFPLFKQAFDDLLQKRLGTSFCASLALGLALCSSEYLVALSLLVLACTTNTLEDWTRRRAKQLLAGSSEFRYVRGVAERFRALTEFEKDTPRWLQSFFVYLATAAAGFALLAKSDVKSSFAVLVIGSASALTVSMSILKLGYLLQASRYGFVIRDENLMERLSSANVVVLDEPAGANRYQNAANATGLFRAMRIRTVLFTDALQPIADALAKRLGTDQVEAELFSDDRPCKIAAMQQRHCKVVCVGGGRAGDVSLAAADVAILTGADTDVSQSVSQEAADAVMLGNDLNDLAELIRTARRATRIGALNCVIAVIVSSIVLGLAIQQKITPQAAVEIRWMLDLGLIALSAQILVPVWKRKPVAAI